MEKFFETTHTRSAAGLAAMYDLEFRQSQDENTLAEGLEWLYRTKGCAVLEVLTPRLENDPVLKSFFQYIKENMSKSN